MAVQTQIQTRRGTAASWTSTNPTLAAGEFGYETDTGKFKIGNGSTAWASLAYTAAATAVTYLFNATSGQTTFSGTDANGLTLAYTVGAEQVYLNGVLQVRGSDYTASNGTSIVLASGALTSDVLNVIAYSAMTVTDTYTQAQADAKFIQVANTPNPSNPVLNSTFQVWQRGTSGVLGGTGTTYTADRWATYTASSGTISRQVTGDTTNLPFIQYCARVQRNSGETATGTVGVWQSFESINSIPFAGKTVTISYYARKGANFSATSDLLSGFIISGTGTDQNLASTGFTGQATVATSNATLTTTWQRFTATGTVATNATQIGLRFSYASTGTAGANDYFEVTGVQVELGSIATPFRTNGGTLAGELAACQRYYIRYSSNGDSNFDLIGPFGSAAQTTQIFIPWNTPTMRTAASAVDYANLRLSDNSGGTPAISNLVLIVNSNPTTQWIEVTTTGATAYRPYTLQANNNATAYIGFSAEL
jgi:hypothetical protein